MSGKELATAGTQELANTEPFDNGLGELDSGDKIIPRLTISQPTTPDIATEDVGKLCVNVLGSFESSMRIALVKYFKTRILFPEKYKRDNDPLCRSHDFITPANDIPGATPMCDSCGLAPLEPGQKKQKHLCSYANWGKGGEAPRCQEVWNMVVVDLETYIPMLFAVKSTAIKPTRKILSAIDFITKAKRMAMSSLQMELGTFKTVNDSGTFYIPTFSNPVPLEKDEAAIMYEIQVGFQNYDVTKASEPETAEPPAQEEDETF